jgi:hypothetical protein
MDMKRVLFSSVAVVLFVFMGNAQEARDGSQKYDFKCGSLITKYRKEVTEYKYSSMEDLREGVDEIFQDFDFSDDKEKEKCELTIELKLELTTGLSVVSRSESITSDCTNKFATEAVKWFKSILITE